MSTLDIDVRPFDFETMRTEKFVDDENHLSYRAQDFLDNLWRRTGGVQNGVFSTTNISEEGTTVTVKSGSTFNIAGTFQIGGITVTANANELNFNDGAIAGQVIANTTVVAGASQDLDTLTMTTLLNVTGNFQLNGTTVDTTAAQLNTLDNIDTTVTAGSLLIGNSLTDTYDTATLTAGDNVTITDADGSITISVTEENLEDDIQENALFMIDVFGDT